jgi:hypothetical protein
VLNINSDKTTECATNIIGDQDRVILGGARLKRHAIKEMLGG